MSLKKSALATSVALGLAISAGPASAAISISSLFGTYPIFQLEDNDYESIGVDPNSDGLLDTGDTLRGILEIQDYVDLTDTTNSFALDGIEANTLSAVFEIEVITKIATATTGFFNYVFGPTSGFESTYGTGAMVAFYEDPIDNFDSGTTCSTGSGGTCEATVTDGSLIIVLGFDDPDDQWFALNTPEDTTAPTNFTTGFSLGTFNYAMSVLFSAVGDFGQFPFDPLFTTIDDGLVDWTGGGVIKGTQQPGIIIPRPQTTNYTSTSDIDLIGFHIPEPTTLALLGAGLFGLGATSRRRKQKSI